MTVFFDLIKNYFSTISVLGIVLASIAWFLKTWMDKRMTAHYELATKTKITELEAKQNSQLHLFEQQIKNELESVSHNRNSRYIEADSRTLDAIEKIWDAVFILNQNEGLIGFFRNIKINEMIENGANSEQKLFEVTADAFNIDESLERFKGLDMHRSRLYLSPKAVKIFDELHGIHAHCLIVASAMRLEPNLRKFVKKFEIRPEITSLIPGSKDGYEKWGGEWTLYCTGILREMLLTELRKMIDGDQYDAAIGSRLAGLRSINQHHSNYSEILSKVPEKYRSPQKD